MLFLEISYFLKEGSKTFEIIFIRLPPVKSIRVSNSAFCSSGNWMGKGTEKEKNVFLKMLRLLGDGNLNSISSALRLLIEKQVLLAYSQLHLGPSFWHSYWGQLLDDKETFSIPAENQRQTISKSS